MTSLFCNDTPWEEGLVEGVCVFKKQDYLKHSADSDIRYRVYNHEGIFVGVYSYLDETGEFKPVKIFME
jgi:hypothetical protein